jgi:hypothetical protein
MFGLKKNYFSPKALVERRIFVITKCRLEATSTGYIVELREDLPLAINAGERKLFEQDRKAYRWAAGGGLIILQCLDQEVALVRLRDAKAPSYGDHWTLGSGLSSSLDEMSDPEKLAVREAVEEFLIATPGGVLIPIFPDEKLTAVAFGAVGSGRHVRLTAGVSGLLASSEYVEAKASFNSLKGECALSVKAGGATSPSFHGLVCVDNGTRGIDFLKLMRIEVPYELKDIAVYDGEDANGKPLNALVGCLVPKESRFVACFQNGTLMKESPSWNDKATPTLRSVLNALK